MNACALKYACMDMINSFSKSYRFNFQKEERKIPSLILYVQPPDNRWQNTTISKSSPLIFI